jgi:hypothetical protein
MSFEGTILNGTVVFENPPALPDGTVVEVAVKAPAEGPKPAAPTLGDRLMKFAGVIKDMPADFAAEHDHYIHGTPRRTPKAEE